MTLAPESPLATLQTIRSLERHLLRDLEASRQHGYRDGHQVDADEDVLRFLVGILAGRLIHVANSLSS